MATASAGKSGVGIGRTAVPEGGPWITATRHHPASARLSSTTFAETVRGHRAVEDGVPSGLDTACRQDDARARKDTAPEDLAMI